MKTASKPFGWLDIFRVGLVQTGLGAIVVLMTSTLNRVMVVELALPAMLPGILVFVHYVVQLSRPRMGYGSDMGRRRTPWIMGGMACLAIGGVGASLAVLVMASNTFFGVLLAGLAFVMIGGGVGAAGTSLLVLLAVHVPSRRRAAAATTVWMMMIVGFVITAGVAGHFLDPFSLGRLVTVTSTVCFAAFVLSLIAVWGIEKRAAPQMAVAAHSHPGTDQKFLPVLRQVWSEPKSRRFAIFVFVSMLAYSAQDLILEPFAGLVFGLTPGETTKLSGLQHGGVLVGMVVVALAGTFARGTRWSSMCLWTVGGCLASAIALVSLVVAGQYVEGWPLHANIFALGMANGAFAVAAIGSMMGLANEGRARREGVRMGIWGAAQAIAFGIGGLAGAVSVDITRYFFGDPAIAYGIVFAVEALFFVIAARLAVTVERPEISREDGDLNRAKFAA